MSDQPSKLRLLETEKALVADNNPSQAWLEATHAHLVDPLIFIIKIVVNPDLSPKSKAASRFAGQLATQDEITFF